MEEVLSGGEWGQGDTYSTHAGRVRVGEVDKGQKITYGLWATAGQDDIVHGPRSVGGLGCGSDGHGPRRTTTQRELGRGLDGGQGLAGRSSSGKVQTAASGGGSG